MHSTSSCTAWTGLLWRRVSCLRCRETWSKEASDWRRKTSDRNVMAPTGLQLSASRAAGLSRSQGHERGAFISEMQILARCLQNLRVLQ
jgi:hypothetical protein